MFESSILVLRESLLVLWKPVIILLYFSSFCWRFAWWDWEQQLAERRQRRPARRELSYLEEVLPGVFIILFFWIFVDGPEVCCYIKDSEALSCYRIWRSFPSLFPVEELQSPRHRRGGVVLFCRRHLFSFTTSNKRLLLPLKDFYALLSNDTKNIQNNYYSPDSCGFRYELSIDQ